MVRNASTQRRGERSSRRRGSGAGVLADGGEHAPSRPRGGVRADEAPGEAREQQRDAELHRGEQERVVLGARVARRADVPADVEPVREAAAGQLGDQREQREGQSGREALVPPRTLHELSVPTSGVEFKRLPSKPLGPGKRPDGAEIPRAFLATLLAEQRQVPARLGRAVEAEQQDPLPLAEAELAGRERDLLAARAEQHAEQPLALALVLRARAA